MIAELTLCIRTSSIGGFIGWRVFGISLANNEV